MAKKQFAQQRIGWHRDARCRALKHPSYKWLNNVLWNLCVEHATEVLPSHMDSKHLSFESDLDVRTVRKGLASMQQECCNLITINDDGSIFVHGVREAHETPHFPFKRQIICKDAANLLQVCSTDAAQMSQNQLVDIEVEVEVEKNNINTTISNMPSDPFFQDPNTDAGYICTYLKNHWKTTETGRKNTAHLTRLLQQRSKDQILTAIDNALIKIDAEFDERKYAPAFKDFIETVADVDLYQKEPVTAPQKPSEVEPDWPAAC